MRRGTGDDPAVAAGIADELSRCIQAFREDPLGKSRRRRRKVARALERAILLASEQPAPAFQEVERALRTMSRAAAYRAEKGLDELTTSTLWVVVRWGLARARAVFEASFPGVPVVARQDSTLAVPTEQRLRSVLPALLDARLRELEALDEHDRSLDAAEGDVTLLDKLNVFSGRPEERRVTELQQQRPWLVGGAVGYLPALVHLSTRG